MKKKSIVILIITSVICFALSFSFIFIYSAIKNNEKSFDTTKDGYVQLALQDSHEIEYVCVNKSYDKVVHIDKFESQEFETYLYWRSSLMDDGQNQIEPTSDLKTITSLCDTICRSHNQYISIYKINNRYIVSELNIGGSAGMFVYIFENETLVPFTKGVLSGYHIVGIKFL